MGSSGLHHQQSSYLNAVDDAEGIATLVDGREHVEHAESVKGYRDMIQYCYKGGDYYEFLRRIPYAEDPNYIYKVKKIEGQLGGYGLSVGEGGE